MHYQPALTPHSDSGRRYDVTFVDLPGCVSQGSHLEHALAAGGRSSCAAHSRDTAGWGLASRTLSLEQARAMDEEEARSEGEELALTRLHASDCSCARNQGRSATYFGCPFALSPRCWPG